MKPETRTVTQLFELDVRYLVPLYQRPYVWDAEHQWEPLWEDVLALLDHQENGLGSDYSHFLGAVVLEQETQNPGEIPIFTVIDGQQRLTTLQLFLAAAADSAKRLGASDEAEIIRDLVVNNPKKASGTDLFKVWPTNTDQHDFQEIMDYQGTESREVPKGNRLAEAYAFFSTQVAEWANAPDAPDRLARLRLLRITLCDLLKVVSITLEHDDNAQVIFETLNARGTPLIALDLVKNAVFHEAARQGLDLDPLYWTVWQPQLDDKYWRKPIRQGRLLRPRAELFLMHWLSMRLRSVVPATELFSTFRSQVLNAIPPPDMTSLIRQFARDAGTLRSFDSQPGGSIEGNFFERLAALDTSTVIPLVLFLFTEPRVGVECRQTCLRFVESWLTRRMLMGLTTKNYNRAVPAILERVVSDPTRADEIVRAELLAGVGQISMWPTDAELRDHLVNRSMYGTIAQARLVMVFRAVEKSLYTSKVEGVTLPTVLSLEHVMPQSWERHWPLDERLDTGERGAAEESRRAHLHRIGNLTLTTLSLNASMSHASWSQKQGALNLGSKLLLNVQLVEQNPTRFDEAAIDARSALLAEIIC